MPAVALLHYDGSGIRGSISLIKPRENTMKKAALALALVVAALSLGGCFVGKGKGKAPAPVVTKG
jgi:hypothetical protein